MKIKNWVILGLAFLAVGFWCNMQALWAYTNHSPILNVLGDVLPFEFSIGDCFVFVGYGVFAFLLGRSLVYGVGSLFLKMRGQK